MSDELKGLRAILAVPTYGAVDPRCSKSVRVAMMSASKRGLEWAGDASPDRMGWGAARNHAVQQLYENPEQADGIVWVDSDILLEPLSIVRLLDNALRLPADFVSGVYHQRLPYHNPVFYTFNAEAQKFQPAEEYPDNIVAPAGGCGFGFVWTSTKLLLAIRDLPTFEPQGGWFPDKRDAGGFGEDLAFCYLAKQAGYQLWIDTGIQVGHVGDGQVITKEDFLREKVKCQPADIARSGKGWGSR